MNDLKFLPITEAYYSTPFNIIHTIFQLGFIEFSCSLLDSSVLKFDKSIRDTLLKHKPEMVKRYISILNIGSLGWIWNTSDVLERITLDYQKVIKDLKYGKDVEFTDISTRNKPIRLSYRGIEFFW